MPCPAKEFGCACEDGHCNVPSYPILEASRSVSTGRLLILTIMIVVGVSGFAMCGFALAGFGMEQVP